jgi:hypothetical protein
VPKTTKPFVTREKLRKKLLYEKGARKMLMKLTPVFNLPTFYKQLLRQYSFDKKLLSQNVT